MGGIGFMAKASAKEEIISLLPDDETIPRPRLSKLIIKNFRTIGNTPVEIYLDDIVVLVGANNVGKSSILRAYEVAMNTGSKAGYLTIMIFLIILLTQRIFRKLKYIQLFRKINLVLNG